jgi:GNAT superfamily N-acetyltransferase
MGWFVRWLERFVQLGMDLVAALIAGLFRAPAVAVARATGGISVRKAAAEEVVGVRHEVLRAGRPRDTAVFDGDDAPDTRHWLAEQAAGTEGSRAVGVASVMRAPHQDRPWQLRGMAVVEGLRGSGVGGALLNAVHADVAAPMWCNARERAIPFYERNGWTVDSEPFDVPGVGPHRRMLWNP